MNHLAHEKSPYLLQHAGNPVDWHPWGPAALARARAEQKPIFLSIGYSTCHWCHVMAHESFEDPAVGAQLNDDFIAIKVDREERPDLDRVYMTYVQSLTGHGGWPLSVWLTPELKPFYGGTYFPPEDRHGRAGFPSDPHAPSRGAGATSARSWWPRASGRSRPCRRGPAAPEAPPAADALSAAGDGLRARAFGYFEQAFDPERGGFGGRAEIPARRQPGLPLPLRGAGGA